MIEKNWKELIKPAKLMVKHNNDQKSNATIIAEPIERGFGVTIGNALRRILLSSLQGSAITSMQVQGALHEFSSLPGVREDLTDMILNIKGIKVKMEEEGPKKIYLNIYLVLLFATYLIFLTCFLKIPPLHQILCCNSNRCNC